MCPQSDKGDEGSLASLPSSTVAMQFSVVSLVFSTFFVTVGAVKFCHLFAYFNKVPVWAFLVFLPTFFVPDFLAICLLRALLRPVRGWFTIITAIIGTLIT